MALADTDTSNAHEYPEALVSHVHCSDQWPPVWYVTKIPAPSPAVAVSVRPVSSESCGGVALGLGCVHCPPGPGAGPPPTEALLDADDSTTHPEIATAIP